MCLEPEKSQSWTGNGHVEGFRNACSCLDICITKFTIAFVWPNASCLRIQVINLATKDISHEEVTSSEECEFDGPKAAKE